MPLTMLYHTLLCKDKVSSGLYDYKDAFGQEKASLMDGPYCTDTLDWVLDPHRHC